MDLSGKCSVCLKSTPHLVNVRETDSNNIKWSFKLSSCVPEVEWTEENLICQLCIAQLEAACAFRNLCLQSIAVRKRQWDLKDEISTSPEHTYEDVIEYTDMKANDSEDSDDLYEDPLPKPRYQCKYCNVKFSSRKVLVQHNKDAHQADRPYDCVYCDKNFKSSSDLTHHEKIHLNQRKYECEICNTSYNTTSILRKHKIIKHISPKEWKYECPHCNRQFPFKSNRDAHIRRHHTNASDQYICFHCNEAFSKKVLLIGHMRTKHSTKKFTKQCHLCQNLYINQVVLEDHMRKEHKIGTTELVKRVKQFKCEVCSKLYTTEKAMKTHCVNCDGIKRHSIKTNTPDVKSEAEELETVLIKQDREIEEQQLKVEETEDLPKDTVTSKRGRKKLEQVSNICQVCGMVFNTRYLAKRHMRNVHATEKNYQCEICDQKFASPVYLNAHKRYHSGERPHICSFCGKGFITGSDLYHHEKIHANKRAYKCDKCPKAFNTSSDLHKHKLCVHQDRSAWKYVCTFCNRRFPLKTNLDAHTKTHTGERNFACHLCDRKCVNRSVLLRHIKSHSNVRLFKCSLCNMEYKYQKSLDIHMTKAHGIGDAKIPERIKKYFCHICPKGYFANNKLQKHIRTHTGERPFSCQMCEKRFIDKSYVKQHLKTAHNVIFSETDLV